MTPRTQRIFIALGAVALALFAGRWLATLLVDRWWAAEFSAAASDFITQVSLVRLLLDAVGSVMAAGWFIGNLLVVYRAIAAVQVSRSVANLEIREAVPRRTLFTSTVAVGAVLGVLAGADLSGDWQTVVLGWNGVTLGLTEPFLGQDAGVYVAQLPLWQLAHGYALLLVGVGLFAVLVLYAVIGAVRWTDSRPAVSDHARQHLGWLLGTLALVLAWGYLLEPFEWVAAGGASTAHRAFSLVELTAPILTGFALATALLSVIWGYRARHSACAAGWLLLMVASITGHYILPAFRAASATIARDDGAVDRLTQYAANLDVVRDSVLVASTEPPSAPPNAPALWSGDIVRALLDRDTAVVVSVTATSVESGTETIPSWLVIRSTPSGAANIFGVRDDRTGPQGQPLPLSAAMTVVDQPLRSLPVGSVRPLATGAAIGMDAPGPQVGPWPRRLAYAWALQEPRLLGALPSLVRVAWQLSPSARLARVAPFAEWGAPTLRIIDGRPVWVADGYITSETFPGTPRLSWRDGETGMVRAGFVGVIDALRGSTRIFARPDGGPLVDVWTRLSGGMVERADRLPSGIRRVATYPTELLQAQAPVVAHRDPAVGRVLGSAPESNGATPFLMSWRDAGATLAELVLYERGDTHDVSAVLEARVDDGRPVLTLWRASAASTVPAPTVLDDKWGRFQSFMQVRDSANAAQGNFIPGPIRYTVTDAQLVASRSWAATTAGKSGALAWVAVASGTRLGAGRTLAEAWENMRGTLAPVPVGANAGALADARRWVRLADSALTRRDFAAFGRAFDALRQALGEPPPPRR